MVCLSCDSEVIPQELQNADRRDRHGIGTQRTVTEADQSDAVPLRPLPLLAGPAPFRSDEHGSIRRRRPSPQRADRFDRR
jgi:hypothetical protein